MISLAQKKAMKKYQLKNNDKLVSYNTIWRQKPENKNISTVYKQRYRYKKYIENNLFGHYLAKILDSTFY